MRRRWFLPASLAAVAAGLLAWSAIPARATSSAPAYAGDFADPFILPVGPTYWAYATGSAGKNLQVMASPDLHTWVGLADPLPILPRWATVGHTWAPSVLKRGQYYVLYYTARDLRSGYQCIGSAVAPTPAGPFVDPSPSPMVCDPTGSIDAQPFVDPATGVAYLIWKSDDNAVGRPSHLWGQRLSIDGRSLTGTAALLLTAQLQTWQAPTMEGPAMMAAGGAYYLFYGAGAWNTAGSGIGYGACSRPRSDAAGRLTWACVDRAAAAPWLGSRLVQGRTVYSGPAGPAMFTDANGVLRLAYHAWTGNRVGYTRGGVRSLWIDRLSFPGGVPALS